DIEQATHRTIDSLESRQGRLGARITGFDVWAKRKNRLFRTKLSGRRRGQVGQHPTNLHASRGGRRRGSSQVARSHSGHHGANTERPIMGKTSRMNSTHASPSRGSSGCTISRIRYILYRVFSPAKATRGLSAIFHCSAPCHDQKMRKCVLPLARSLTKRAV